MAEDAGKKEEMRKFLRRVKRGQNFIEDIWIERDVKQPGSVVGEFNEATSSSGKTISNITELLTDDLRYSFDEGSFTFRFIASVPGSGKTTLIDYLCELIDTEPRYRKSAIVVKFRFGTFLAQPDNKSFGVKFFVHILTQTFWEIMRYDNTSLSNEIKDVGEKSLGRIIGNEKIAYLKLKIDSQAEFCEQLGKIFAEKTANFQSLFFTTIKYFYQNAPQVTFVYLMDELDALDSHSNYLQDARVIIRDLINGAVEGEEISLMTYIVGNNDYVENFIRPDQGLYRRVSDSVIKLVAYRKEECEKIKSRIEERIRDAYHGCKDFDEAWQEIKSIKLESFTSLGEFCKKFASRVIEIHEKYFNSFDRAFNQFESKARELAEAQARKSWSKYLGDSLAETSCIQQSQEYHGHTKWKKYKGRSGYELLVAYSTTIIRGRVSGKTHAIDCYAELWHNGHQIAEVYGEAKNYALIKEHVDTFHEWLIDFDFDPFPTDGNPLDLAFMIAPSCTALQLRKLKIKGIQFIEEEKIIDMLNDSQETNDGSTSDEDISRIGININNVELGLLKTVFQGTKISSENTFNRLVRGRPYRDLDELIKRMKFSNAVETKLLAKVSNNEIYFGVTES